MNGIDRIAQVFRDNTTVRLMTHVVGGYPDLSTSKELLLMMAREGADIIEVQLPFSDPSADGPLIVEANYRALAQGVTTSQVLNMLAEVRTQTDVPLLLMSYLNPLFVYGIDALIAQMVDIGLDGLIVPDYPADEPELCLIEKANEANLAFVPLIAPATSLERATWLAGLSRSPFVYAVLRLGVTGRKTEISAENCAWLSSIKQATGKAVAAGFGISDRSQIMALSGAADCGIVGSGLLRVIKNAAAAQAPILPAAKEFIRSLAGRSKP